MTQNQNFGACHYDIILITLNILWKIGTVFKIRPGTNRVKYKRLNNYPDIKIQIIISIHILSLGLTLSRILASTLQIDSLG